MEYWKTGMMEDLIEIYYILKVSKTLQEAYPDNDA
jgi:hypothetical protein